MLIGREREVRKLKELYESDSAELVALYGRRRVGKTFLVDSVFAGKITFRHSGLSPLDDRYADESSRKSRLGDQLKHFTQSLALQGLLKSRKKPTSWLEAFYMLEAALQEKDNVTERQLIFIDEIQWLDTPKSGFMTGLEAFWNGWACHRTNLMVIVCGSSTSWILNKLIHNHGGLYGRVTSQIRLLPFTLHECEQFFEAKRISFSRYDIAQAYMAVGGIPYYLRLFDRKLSLPQNIQAIFFDSDAPLREEFDELFSSIFSNPDTMKTIVRALSKKKRGLTRSELLQETKIADSGEFSKHLKALISGNFIMKYCSYGTGKREELYKLIDPFCIFSIRFVQTNDSSHLQWINIEDSGSVTAWRGLAFENVCFHHAEQIKAALGISGVSTKESLWLRRGTEESPGAQIDMIIDRRDRIVNLCEMKFTVDIFTMKSDDHFALIRRKNALMELIPKRSSIQTTLVTTYGLTTNEYYSDFVHVVTLNELFAF